MSDELRKIALKYFRGAQVYDRTTSSYTEDALQHFESALHEAIALAMGEPVMWAVRHAGSFNSNVYFLKVNAVHAMVAMNELYPGERTVEPLYASKLHELDN